MRQLIIGTFLTVLVGSTFSFQPKESFKMNQTQVIGSHNSYKIGIERPLMDLILADRPEAIGLDYNHIPIAQQLDLGLRSLEIDVLHDPEGSRFSYPRGLDLVKAKGVEPLPYNPVQMNEPGFKVLHIPDIDFRSHCSTFTLCLAEVKSWSQAHRNHLPIIITINPKTSGIDKPGFAQVIPFDEKVLAALDAEILKVFSANELVTPNQIKGKAKSLREAVVNKGWPDLGQVRGKILLVFDADEELTKLYNKADLTFNRPMFTNSDFESPHAAFFIMNDPVKQEKEIVNRVKLGFMVRTRADSDTREARTGDKTRFMAAIRSGAQVITTDYYLKSLSPNKDFGIDFNGKFSQCNPVLVSSRDCGVE